jgi:hypothetical protein
MMSFLDKLMFWKRNDDNLGEDIGNLGGKNDLAFGNNFNPAQQQFGQQNLGLPQGNDMGMGQQYSASPEYPQDPNMGQQNQQSAFNQNPQSFSQRSYQQPYNQPSYNQQEEITSKNIEVISSKIDTLKASLDSINQRLANLEAIARGDDSNRRRYY